MGDVNIDNIVDVNDHIIDEHLSSQRFEDSLEEFYILVAMCSYMTNNNLYDEYFFSSFSECLEEFNNSNSLINEIEDELQKDIDLVSEYIKKSNVMSEYYEKLSSVYNDRIEESNEE